MEEIEKLVSQKVVETKLPKKSVVVLINFSGIHETAYGLNWFDNFKTYSARAKELLEVVYRLHDKASLYYRLTTAVHPIYYPEMH